jgi:hypothetical protein
MFSSSLIYYYLVSRFNAAARNNFCEYALGRHDAVSDLSFYFAAVMAFLADLGYFERHFVVDHYLLAYPHAREIDAPSGYVFGEIAGIDAGRDLAHPVRRFVGQKRYLTVPVAGVRVGADAFGYYLGAFDRRFFDAFNKAYVDGADAPFLYYIYHYFHRPVLK